MTTTTTHKYKIEIFQRYTGVRNHPSTTHSSCRTQDKLKKPKKIGKNTKTKINNSNITLFELINLETLSQIPSLVNLTRLPVEKAITV